MNPQKKLIERARHMVRALETGDPNIQPTHPEAEEQILADLIAEIQRLDRRDDYQTVKLLLSMLQNNPWPYADTRWEFIQKWCEQYIEVNNRYIEVNNRYEDEK